jgi:hypothetical protein
MDVCASVNVIIIIIFILFVWSASYQISTLVFIFISIRNRPLHSVLKNSRINTLQFRNVCADIGVVELMHLCKYPCLYHLLSRTKIFCPFTSVAFLLHKYQKCFLQDSATFPHSGEERGETSHRPILLVSKFYISTRHNGNLIWTDSLK